ncbi:golgin subfamily B member 1-like [Onychomys torridus]|uniref:golgin subfamily B member 1-like n=1 Tax=Onychomys torridus TaxID=38674 RepID=UPI00167FBF29|nr:golgin subfamily B member 1-like [Onychomys torridus]
MLFPVHYFYCLMSKYQELPHKSDMELNNTIPDNVLERLSDAEKLVVELKEIIQQKDLQLLQQDEVLQEERKAADTKN